MAHRLPVPGSDDGTWGDILNDFLTQSHNSDGTIKSSAVAGKANTADLSAVATSGSYADLTSKPAIQTLIPVATVTIAGALVTSKHNPVDATSGALTMTLPSSPTDGAIISVEKYDSSTNAVTISGSIRGASSTITLSLAHETVEFVAGSNTWWPVAGHKTLGSLDSRYQSRGFINVVATGTTADSTALAAAVASGSDVEISALTSTPVIVPITATLVLSATEGQKLVTRNVLLAPNFVGDCVQIRARNQRVEAAFSASLQPAPANSTTYQEVAAIRIGSADGSFYPKNASVARSRIVDAWNGNGIIWEYGAHVDFTQFSIDTSCTFDGIRANPNNQDTNEGFFADTRVSNCGRYGYWVINNANTAANSPREHLFLNAKAYGCNVNFRIETSRNQGWIYSENGTNPDQFTSTSFANNIFYTSTSPSFQAVSDVGTFNRIQGQDHNGRWSTIRDLVQALDINAIFAGRQEFTQTADNAFSDTILDTSNSTTVTHQNNAGLGTRTDMFNGGVGINGAAGSGTRLLQFLTSGLQRWQIGSNTDPEAGSNAGSNLAFNSRADDGTALTTTAYVTRATGIWTFRRAIVTAVKTVTVSTSGALTVDVTTGNIIEITLQANVTATTFNNMSVGQRVTVVWIQDATGGRTYAWQAGARFVAGTAPTAGTTAARRDIVEFYYGSDSLWHEISRAINVA